MVFEFSHALVLTFISDFVRVAGLLLQHPVGTGSDYSFNKEPRDETVDRKCHYTDFPRTAT